MSAPAGVIEGPSVRAVLRVLLVVVTVVLTLALMYLLRKPLTWIFIAAFLSIALSGRSTSSRAAMRRGFAVAIVYLLLILTPFALIGLLVPPIVTQANNLVQNLPRRAGSPILNDNSACRSFRTTTTSPAGSRRRPPSYRRALATPPACWATSASGWSTRSSPR